MEVDLFTVIAQIINFIILVVLLRVFLYKPITNAMNERKEIIENREAEAEEKINQAKEEKQKYEKEMEEIENSREKLLDSTREEAKERTQELMERSEKEYSQKSRRWEEDFVNGKKTFIRNLRREVAGKVCKVTERVLGTMANVELEEMVFNVFINKFDNEEESERADEIRKALSGKEEGITVNSAFGLSDKNKKILEKALKKYLEKEQEIKYSKNEKLICGIELVIKDYRISWSINEYMDEFREQLLDGVEGEDFEVKKGAV